MSRRLLFLNAVLVVLSALFAVALARELSTSRRPPPAPRAASSPVQSAESVPEAARGRAPAANAYGVIAARTLFHPSRTEPAATSVAAPVAPPAPKPFLHGVVLDDNGGRAYLEDPATKRVFGYRLGDVVGGGRLEKISADRVVIARPEGSLEVQLRDPTRPRPAPPAVGPGAPRTGVRPGVATPPRPQTQPGTGVEAAPAPSAPPRPLPIPPRLLRRQPSGEPQAGTESSED